MEIQKKLQEWKQMNQDYLEKIKFMVQNINSATNPLIISYFTYSLQMNHDISQSNYILGSFHIQNIGNQPLNNLHICIKMKTESYFEFSGKYVHQNSKQSLRLSSFWERINEDSDQNEYWLKPVQKFVLKPSESLSFANFQVKWVPKGAYSAFIDGFVYGEEISEGIRSLNQIHINGIIPEKKEVES